MKTVSKLKNSQVAPRKISVLLCQVPAATVVFVQCLQDFGHSIRRSTKARLIK
jgi:hypothetical protein